MIPVIVILLYLCVVAYIGSVAFRKGKENTEDFFLAGRTIGTAVFFLSLFATNMTAFAILGSSGAAYKQGIGIFLISHDIHDVFELSDRVAVIKNGRIVGTARVQDVTKDEVLGMIILGKCPPGAIPGPGALNS